MKTRKDTMAAAEAEATEEKRSAREERSAKFEEMLVDPLTKKTVEAFPEFLEVSTTLMQELAEASSSRKLTVAEDAFMKAGATFILYMTLDLISFKAYGKSDKGN